MSQVRRRRALRCTVLAASTAVLASFVVAPAAQADVPATPATPTATTAPAPSTDLAPVEPPVTEVPEPGPTSEPAPTSVPSEPTTEPTTLTGAAPGPGDLVSGDTVVGELVQAWPDPTAEEHSHEDAEGHHEAPLSWIEPIEGAAVRVLTESLPDVSVGSTLAVTVGDEVVDEAAAEQGFEPAVEVQAATVVDAAGPDPTTASAGAAPTNTVTAVLVLPAGATSDGMTIGTVLNALNGAVSSFWDEQSNRTVRISAVQGAAGWVSSPQSCSSAFGLWNDVAARIGWTGGAGKHLMLYVPANAPGCSYGLGTVGTSIGTGGRSYVQAAALSVMAHELGHNFGLGHSSQVQCDSSLEAGTCQTRSYYDFYDVMGISWGQVGTLNAAQSARLGLLPAGEHVALTPSSAATTVTLAPVSAASGVRAVKFTAPDGTVYYLEYRQASGQDAWLGDSRNAYRLDNGVVLRRAGSADGNTSLLLDGSPSASSRWSSDMQQSIPAGSAVSVAGSAFSVAVLSVGAGGASVRVVSGGASAMSLPRGNWEAVSVSGAVISVEGWAFDPDQATAASQVHVYVDGGGRAVTAGGSRPDVGAAFPGAGAAHGFSDSRTVAPGAHQVCVYAIDVDVPSRNQPLGCRTVLTQVALPLGNWESVSVSGSQITVSGWGLDPDQPSVSSAVHVYVDGGGQAVTADGSRPDVGAAFAGAGAAHGFSVSRTVAPGAHQVCVYAIDVDVPSRNQPLGCRTVLTQVTPPVGNWEITDIDGGVLTVAGWALDPDQLATSSPVHVYVDGVGQALRADGSRPDIAAAFPGAGSAHGFTTSVSLARGEHQVCVYAIDLDSDWRHTPFGCRSVTVR